MAHLKPQAKILLLVVAGAVLVFGLRTLAQYGIIPTPGIMKALVPQKAILPDVKDAQVANVSPVALPSDAPANVQATLFRGAIWEWNAQMGLLFANGGPTTTQGSLMAKRNVNLTLYRQDDTNKMQEDLIACAKELHDGANQCSTGANFVVIMGDGSGQFAAAINPQKTRIISPAISTTAAFRRETYSPKAELPGNPGCSPLMGSNFSARYPKSAASARWPPLWEDA
jgi:hypothetical protein